MVIDIHTHAFPDKIAARAIASLQAAMADTSDMVAHTDGTLSGLQDKLIADGIDIGVVCPIATKEKQTETINEFALGIRNEHLISFGSVYPYQEDYERVLEELSENGFKGIKLHPEYQQFDIDSKEAVRIIAKCEKLGLTVIVHSGFDPAYREPYHCTPKKLKNLLECVSGENVIAAHLGSLMMWDDVEKYLVGTPIMFDTANVGGFISPEQYKRIILEHGADRVLFGSDCPWESPAFSLKKLKELKLPKADFEQITYKNACGILGIKL